MNVAVPVSPALDRALAYSGGSHTRADIEAAVERGDCQEWVGDRSVLITELKQTPQQRILLFWLAAGDLTELRAMAGPICEWGQQQGCVKAQLLGRLGWARSVLTREDGWKQTAVVLEKDL